MDILYEKHFNLQENKETKVEFLKFYPKKVDLDIGQLKPCEFDSGDLEMTSSGKEDGEEPSAKRSLLDYTIMKSGFASPSGQFNKSESPRRSAPSDQDGDELQVIYHKSGTPHVISTTATLPTRFLPTFSQATSSSADTTFGLVNSTSLNRFITTPTPAVQVNLAPSVTGQMTSNNNLTSKPTKRPHNWASDTYRIARVQHIQNESQEGRKQMSMSNGSSQSQGGVTMATAPAQRVMVTSQPVIRRLRDTILVTGLPENITKEMLLEKFGIDVVKNMTIEDCHGNGGYGNEMNGAKQALIQYEEPHSAGIACLWNDNKQVWGGTIQVTLVTSNDMDHLGSTSASSHTRDASSASQSNDSSHRQNIQLGEEPVNMSKSKESKRKRKPKKKASLSWITAKSEQKPWESTQPKNDNDSDAPESPADTSTAGDMQGLSNVTQSYPFVPGNASNLPNIPTHTMSTSAVVPATNANFQPYFVNISSHPMGQQAHPPQSLIPAHVPINNAQTLAQPSAPSLTNSYHWYCSSCGTYNHITNALCKYCGYLSTAGRNNNHVTSVTQPSWYGNNNNSVKMSRNPTYSNIGSQPYVNINDLVSNSMLPSNQTTSITYQQSTGNTYTGGSQITANDYNMVANQFAEEKNSSIAGNQVATTASNQGDTASMTNNQSIPTTDVTILPSNQCASDRIEQGQGNIARATQHHNNLGDAVAMITNSPHQSYDKPQPSNNSQLSNQLLPSNQSGDQTNNNNFHSYTSWVCSYCGCHGNTSGMCRKCGQGKPYLED